MIPTVMTTSSNNSSNQPVHLLPSGTPEISDCCVRYESSTTVSNGSTCVAPMMEEPTPSSSFPDPNACLNFIVVLVNAGVSNDRLRQHIRALECYSQALLNLGMQEEYFQIQEEQGRVIPCLRATNNVSNNNDDDNNNNSRDKPPEYDEGMLVHNHPLNIPTPVSSSESPNRTFEDSIPSLLCYNIGQTYSKIGQYETAKRWFERSLQRSLNSSSEYMVKLLHNLGYCTYRAGDCCNAVELYHQALSLILETNMGSSYLATALNCLGVLIFRSQDSEKVGLSLELFQQSLKIYRSSASENIGGKAELAASIATVLNNIGRVHYRANEYSQALPYYEEAIQLRRQVLGCDSIDTAATSFNLGQALHKGGQLDGAMRYYMDFVRILRSLGASDTADIALALRAIAEIHRDRGDLKSSYQYLELALDAQHTSLGTMHHQVAQTLNMLGNLCYEMQDFNSALKYYKEGLEVEENVLDSDHPHIMVTWNNIALIQKLLGLYEDALTSYRNVYLLQVEIEAGEESLGQAELLAQLGLMHYHLCQYEESFYCYEDSLRIRRDHYETSEHPEIASNLNSMGLVLFKQDQFDLAKACFTESLRIRRAVLGPHHRDVGVLVSCLENKWDNIDNLKF